MYLHKNSGNGILKSNLMKHQIHLLRALILRYDNALLFLHTVLILELPVWCQLNYIFCNTNHVWVEAGVFIMPKSMLPSPSLLVFDQCPRETLSTRL